jgi:hypothetical protein
MERLNLNSICDIVYRLRRGQSGRAIAKDLGHSCHTLPYEHCLAHEKGRLDLLQGVPEPDELLRELCPAPSAPAVASSVEPYRSLLEDLLNASVEMARIHSRLVRKRGTTHEAPLARFSEFDASALIDLPEEPFELVGRKPDVHVCERVVQIHDGVHLIVSYEMATGKGRRLSQDEFYPPERSPYLPRRGRTCRWCWRWQPAVSSGERRTGSCADLPV